MNETNGTDETHELSAAEKAARDLIHMEIAVKEHFDWLERRIRAEPLTPALALEGAKHHLDGRLRAHGVYFREEEAGKCHK